MRRATGFHGLRKIGSICCTMPDGEWIVWKDFIFMLWHCFGEYERALPPPNKECAVLYSAWIEMFSIEYFYLIKNCLVVNNFLLLKIVLFHLSGWKGVESKLKCVKVSFQTSLFNEHCNVMAPFQTSLFNEHCNVTAPFKNSALKICKNTPTCLFKN